MNQHEKMYRVNWVCARLFEAVAIYHIAAHCIFGASWEYALRACVFALMVIVCELGMLRVMMDFQARELEELAHPPITLVGPPGDLRQVPSQPGTYCGFMRMRQGEFDG